MHLEIKIKKSDEDKQLVYAEVYPSGVPDSDGDFTIPEELEKAAHQFLLDGNQRNIDVQHDGRMIDACIVESWMQYDPSVFYRTGSWCVCIYIEDPFVWAAVKAGELNGLSMGGSGWSTPVEMEIELPDGNYTVGETFPADDGHTHRYVAFYTDEAKYAGGVTEEINGHQHEMIRGTLTEESEGHTHKYGSPYNFIELL